MWAEGPGMINGVWREEMEGLPDGAEMEEAGEVKEVSVVSVVTLVRALVEEGEGEQPASMLATGWGMSADTDNGGGGGDVGGARC